MANYNRPQNLPRWCVDNASNCTDAPTDLEASGFTQGSVPVAEYENARRRLNDLWLGYFDSTLTKQTLTSALNLDLRLAGGGYFTFDPDAAKLAWDEDLFLSVPGVPLSANKIAAGSVLLGSGALAYVTANIPFYTQASLVSGDAVARKISSTSAIAAGQSVTGSGIPDGTTVVSVGDGSVTLSAAATTTSDTATLCFVGAGALVVQSTTTNSFTPAANTVVIAVGQANTAVVGANSGQMLVRPLEQKRLLGTGHANVIRAPAGQALTAAQACYLSSGANGRTVGALYPCDATAANGSTRARFIGFASLAADASAAAHVVANGVIGGFVGLSIGSTYFLDPASNGAITATRPATTGQWAVPVGTAVSTTQLLVNPAAATAAVQIAAARAKRYVEMGNVYMTASNTAYGVQKVAANGNTTLHSYTYNYLPEVDVNLIGVIGTLTPANTPELILTLSQSAPLINPKGYANSSSYLVLDQKGSTGGTSQAAQYKFDLSGSPTPLNAGCSYSMSASSSDATTNNAENLHVQLLLDVPA